MQPPTKLKKKKKKLLQNNALHTLGSNKDKVFEVQDQKQPILRLMIQLRRNNVVM